MKWAYKNPERQFQFLSSAAVRDELVVVGGRDKLVHTIETGTGKKRWTYNAGGRVDSSPVIVGKRVFVGSANGDVLALELDSGELTWKFQTGAPITASPSISDGRLFIGNADGQLFCFGQKAKTDE